MNEAVFKTTVMGGFNKSDVLAFIDKQDKQFRDREKDLLARVESLSRDLKSETQRAGDLAQQVSALGVQLEQAQNQSAGVQQAKSGLEQALTERDAELERLRGEMADTAQKLTEAQRNVAEANVSIQRKGGLEQTLAQRDAELEQLRREKTELAGILAESEKKAADANARADALANKLELIDKTEDQIGRALLQAQQTADKITRSAKDEGELVVSRANARVKALNVTAQQKLDTLLLAVSEYERRIAQARAEAAAFFASTDTAFDTMRDTAQDILANFTDAFRAEEPESAESDCSEDDAKDADESVKFDFSRNSGSEF